MFVIEPRLVGPQNGRVGEAPADRGLLSEYFPSIPIMSALMGKTTEGSATASPAPGGTGFKGFAMVRHTTHCASLRGQWGLDLL